jgi:hypothetical protein
VPAYALHGYVVASRDDRLADAQGRFPEALRNEADWAYFQAGLDRAHATLLGRLSHEASPNHRSRLRIVVSSAARGVERRADALWWNPGEASLAEALAAAVPEGGEIAVPGGQAVFDLVGPSLFTAFHLARAHDVAIPDGRGVFAACEAGGRAEDVLRAGGLVPGRTTWLDEAARVSLTVFTRATIGE